MAEETKKVYISAIEHKEFDNPTRYPNLITALNQHIEQGELTREEQRDIMQAWLDRQGEIHNF